MHDIDKKVIRMIRAKAQDSCHAMEQDGGKGSGNWGHKGRPGKRGGSGGGGGSHNREGSKETGFTRKAATPAAPSAPATTARKAPDIDQHEKRLNYFIGNGYNMNLSNAKKQLGDMPEGTIVSVGGSAYKGEKDTYTKQKDGSWLVQNNDKTNPAEGIVDPDSMARRLASCKISGAEITVGGSAKPDVSASSENGGGSSGNKNPNPHIVEGKEIKDTPEQQRAVDFVYEQIGVDLNKYRDSHWLTEWEKASSNYYGAPTVELDWKGMPKQDQRAIENLANAYGGKYDLVDTSAWSKALVWKGDSVSPESSSVAPEPNRDKYGNPNSATGDPDTDLNSLKSLFQFREANKGVKARNNAANEAIRGILNGMEPGTILKRKDGIAAGNLMKNADGTWTPVDNNGKVLRYQFGQPVKYGASYAAESAQTDMYLESIQYPRNTRKDAAPTFTGFNYPSK